MVTRAITTRTITASGSARLAHDHESGSSALFIVGINAIAQRNASPAGWIASFPTITLLSIAWLLFDQRGEAQIAKFLAEGLSVRGLNTAATLWTTAAVGTLAGLGFAAESAIGTGAILLINVVVRPIVRRINLQLFAGMEAATPYVVRVVCRSEEEQHVRALILQAMSDTSLLLHAISSRDLEDASKVEVRASVAASGRAEAALERIVGRLSLVPSVSSAGWQVDSRNGEMTRAGET